MRRIRESLQGMDPLVLEQLWHDIALRRRMIRETVGPLFASFRSHLQFDEGLGGIPVSASAATWRPLASRTRQARPEGMDTTLDEVED